MDTPRLERSARAPRRHGSTLSIGSGLLLAVCFFLPFVEDCGEAMAPVDYVGDASVIGLLILAIPYLMGLAAAAVAFTVMRTPRASSGAKALFTTVAALLTLTTVLIVYTVFAAPPYTLILVPMWALMIRVMVRGRKLSHERKAARAIAVIGGMCIPWFTLFVLASLPDPLPYYGAWLSLAAAIGLAVGGSISERQLLRQ